MAGFLRKKPKQEPPARPAQPSGNASSSSATSSGGVPPLFARFASTANNNNNNGSAKGSGQRMVSPPMVLSSGSKRDVGAARGGHGGGSTYGGSSSNVTPRDSRRAQDPRPGYGQASNSSYSTSNANYANANYEQQSNPNGSISPTSPTTRLVTAIDKPLPSPVPQQQSSSPVLQQRSPVQPYPGDTFGSPPRQSAIPPSSSPPANRRFSRGAAAAAAFQQSQQRQSVYGNQPQPQPQQVQYGNQPASQAYQQPPSTYANQVPGASTSRTLSVTNKPLPNVLTNPQRPPSQQSNQRQTPVPLPTRSASSDSHARSYNSNSTAYASANSHAYASANSNGHGGEVPGRNLSRNSIAVSSPVGRMAPLQSMSVSPPGPVGPGQIFQPQPQQVPNVSGNRKNVQPTQGPPPSFNPNPFVRQQPHPQQGQDLQAGAARPVSMAGSPPARVVGDRRSMVGGGDRMSVNGNRTSLVGVDVDRSLPPQPVPPQQQQAQHQIQQQTQRQIPSQSPQQTRRQSQLPPQPHQTQLHLSQPQSHPYLPQPPINQQPQPLRSQTQTQSPQAQQPQPPHRGPSPARSDFDAGLSDFAIFQEFTTTLPSPPNSLTPKSREQATVGASQSPESNLRNLPSTANVMNFSYPQGSNRGPTSSGGATRSSVYSEIPGNSSQLPPGTSPASGILADSTLRPPVPVSTSATQVPASPQSTRQNGNPFILDSSSTSPSRYITRPPVPVQPNQRSVPTPIRAYDVIQQQQQQQQQAHRKSFLNEVEPGFPTPSPPPPAELPPAQVLSPQVHGRRLPQAPVYQQAQQPHLRPQPQQQYSTQSSSSLPRKSSMTASVTGPSKGKPLIFAAMTATIENESTPPSRDHPDHPTSPSEYASPKPQLQAVLPTQPESSSGPNASTSGSASRPIPIPQTQSQIPAAAPISLSASPPLNTHSRLHGPRQIPKSPSPPPNTQMPFTPQTPPRTRKLSKARNQQPSFDMTAGPTPGSSPEQQRNIGKVRPTTPNSKARPTTPISPNTQPVASKPLEPAFQMMEVEPGIAIGDDPFARIEGVTMLGPSPPPSRDGHAGGSVKKQKSLKGSTEDAKSVIGDEERPSTANGNGNASEGEGLQVPVTATVVGAPPTPISPEDVKAARRKERKERKERERLEKERLLSKQNGNDKDKGKSKELFPSHPPMREPITLAAFLADPNMLCSLLSFLSFTDWLLLSSVSREIRVLMVQNPLLREEVLERYLNTVGYRRWVWEGKDPLGLSLQDLSDYMRGVSTPTHEYARVANMYVHSLSVHPDHRDPLLYETVRSYTAATRAYTRVVLRLRVQAEKESAAQSVARGRANGNGYSPGSTNGTINGNGYFPPSSSHRATTASRQSSRAPSPARSSFSHSHAGHSGVSLPNTHNSSQTQLPIAKPTAFQSPLFRLRRAPLLRVFVPSPEGDWLSDKSVLECEAECKRAGVLHLLRMGDVVWDVAVGDEGNVGRLIWDGSYLIDLDYTYSPIGDLPKYMPTLAFPPSYFHRVIRTGSTMTNPIVHIDLSPWGEEIATNLQLLQDRVRTETPQGAYHNVVRWVHRSSFMIRPPPRNPQSTRGRPTTPRIPIPETENLFVDPGWYGAIVVETEGTNEALADLQDRCGPGAFPPRARGAHVPMVQIENRKVFRILREKSRPGEIWIKAVSVKERLL